MSGLIRVLIVDDQAIIRGGLRMILDHADDITVVGEAGDGIEAVEVAERANPHVILMDIRMPRLDGIAATERILAAARNRNVPAPSVLVLTTFEDEEYVVGSFRAGAAGFLLKDATPPVLLDAVRTLASGQALVDPSVTRTVIDRWIGAEQSPPDVSLIDPALAVVDGAAPLTERELDTWRALAEGRSNKEIAALLFVSEATVKTHVSTLLSKLGVASRVQAVVAAYDVGLVRPNPR